MEIFDLCAFIISLTAFFSYINYRFLKLPPTIGLMVLSLGFTLVLMGVSVFSKVPSKLAEQAILHLDFEHLLLNSMLAFMLFAGAIHIDFVELRSRILPVVFLSTIGVLLSTSLVGLLTWLILPSFGFIPSFLNCLIFGAIISPTDPIAVLGILKTTKISKGLRAKISGESLFNDGISVILFTTLLSLASDSDSLSISNVALHFVREAIGGLGLGVAIGYLGFLLMRPINNYQVEVMLTLAFVMGGYSLANYLHVSGPLAMVVAGIATGNQILNRAVDAISRDYIEKFWELVDEILNAVLFLLIGLELLVIKQGLLLSFAGIFVYFIVLFARFISVGFTIKLLQLKVKFERETIQMLTWGGLRGGISVAMALSLPFFHERDFFLMLTYVVVVMSILIQGLTIGALARWIAPKI